MKSTVKKTVSLILACFVAAMMLVGCGNSGNDGENGNGNSNRKYINGLDGAKLALAGERLSGDFMDKTDGVFDGVAADLRTMADEGRTIMAAAHTPVSPENVFYAPSAADNGAVFAGLSEREYRPVFMNTPTHTEIAARSIAYEQFNETVRMSVELAERGAEHIEAMKEHVREVDKWVRTGIGKMLLHVEENSELLVIDNNTDLFVCYRTRNDDGAEKYEILRKYKSEYGHTTRATYIKNSVYEVMDTQTNRADPSLRSCRGIMAYKNGGIWECADLRYYHENAEDPFTAELIIISDEFSIGASDRSADEDRMTHITISSGDRSADIVRVCEYPDQAVYGIDLGAFSGYRGIIADGRPSLVLADGTLIGGDGRIGENAKCSLTVFETVAGTEAELEITVIADGKEAQRAFLRDILTSWGLECMEPLNKVMASMDSSRVEIDKMFFSYKWNGYNISNKADMNKALTEELKKFDALEEMAAEFKDAPEVEVKKEETTVPMFAELKDADVNYEIKPDGTVYIISAEAGIEDVTLFSEGERYRIGFALIARDGLIHIDVTPTGETVHSGGAFRLACEGVTLSFPEVAAGEYGLAIYFESSEGIRSTAAYKFGTVTVAEKE